MIAIIIHGGAWSIPISKINDTKNALENTLQNSFSMLASGKPALDVVEFVVNCLEDNPIFDAGFGSSPNAEGEVEMDAIIIDGTDLNFGAVAGIKNVRNPISVARKVLELTDCCLLVGDGATKFAHKNGFEFVANEDLIVKDGKDKPLGTVGAVAIDSQGKIASATSTGGIPNKMFGRVGDTPLIGCGAIADNSIGGVSATGEGELLMRLIISKVVIDCIQRGLSPNNSSEYAINLLEKKFNGKGGVICLNKDGLTGYAFNTERMAVAYINGNGQMKVNV